LKDFYTRRAKTLGTTLDTVLANNKNTYDVWGNYNNIYGYGISSPENYIDKYNETFIGSLNPAIKNGTELMNNFITQMGDINSSGTILGDSYKSWWDYSDSIVNVLNSIGEEGEDFVTTAARWMDETSDDLDAATNKVHQLTDALGTDLSTAISYVSNVQNEWTPIMEEAVDMIENLGNAIDGLIEKMNEYNSIELKELVIPDSSGLSSRYTAAIAAAGGGSSGGSGNGGGGSSTGTNPNEEKTNYITVKMNWPNELLKESIPTSYTAIDYEMSGKLTTLYNSKKSQIQDFLNSLMGSGQSTRYDYYYKLFGSSNNFLKWIKS